jgi:DNA-binding transcriptional LysR family regulator
VAHKGMLLHQDQRRLDISRWGGGQAQQAFRHGDTAALITDGYQAWRTLDGVTHFGCAAHAGRKFGQASRAQKKAGGLAPQALALALAFFQLHVVPSVVTKRVSDLEHTLGAQLFHRSTRQVTLTEQGQKFLSKASVLIAEFDNVITSLKQEEGKLEGQIRLKAPTTLTVLYLADILSAFQHEHERITMEVLLVDRSVNPVEEGCDIVITGLSESYDGVIDMPLCQLEQVVCAWPEYLAGKAVPLHPRDLVEHDCLIFKPKGPSWQFESKGGPITIDVPQKLVANENYMLFASACAGNGLQFCRYM